LVTSYVETAF